MLIDSKSQLAKLLATENITVEMRKTKTAYFDLKSRLLVIPIMADGLSKHLYDLFIGHEVGHALWTPEEGWRYSIVELKVPRSVLNIVEDARIEKLIKRKFPGLRPSFSKGYKELVEKNFFKTEGVDLNKMNFLDRINLHFKAGAALGVRFDKLKEQSLVDEIDSCETFQDALDVAKKIAALMKEQQKEQRKNKKEQDKKDTEESGEEKYDYQAEFGDEEEDSGELQGFGDIDDELEDAEEQELSEDDKEKPVKSEDNSEERSEEEEDDKDDVPAGQTTPSIEDNSTEDEDYNEDEQEIRSHTDEAFQEREGELLEATNFDYVYGNIPEGINLDKILVSHKQLMQRLKTYYSGRESADYINDATDRARFNEFRRKSNKVVSYLVKEFELRKNAEQLKRSSVSKTGELNMNKVFSYQFTDDIFKRITVMPGGKSHGLVLFIDWSGSMDAHLSSTIKQLLNLVLFCKKVNIPFEVYAFSNHYMDKKPTPSRYYYDTEPDAKDQLHTYKQGDIVLRRLNLLNFFSSKMSNTELSYMANVLLKLSEYRQYAPYFLGRGGTPLNEAVLAAIKLVPKFRADYKLQIVNTVFLTDGEGHTLSELCEEKTSFYTTYGKRAVIRHRKTGATARIEYTNSYGGRSYTSALLKVFKQVTGSNVIGFYLLDNKDFKRYVYSHAPAAMDRESLRAEFRKEKNMVFTSEGYDEYYLIKADTDVDEDSELEVKEGASTRSLTTAFIKYNTSKVSNRVILNKFIGLIS